jgi:hypothetical protein
MLQQGYQPNSMFNAMVQIPQPFIYNYSQYQQAPKPEVAASSTD